MTVQVGNKKWIFAIICSVFIALGIGAFVLAYGLSDGWDVVAAWFTGKYAMLLYILLGCYALVVLLMVLWDWVRKV